MPPKAAMTRAAMKSQVDPLLKYCKKCKIIHGHLCPKDSDDEESARATNDSGDAKEKDSPKPRLTDGNDEHSDSLSNKGEHGTPEVQNLPAASASTSKTTSLEESKSRLVSSCHVTHIYMTSIVFLQSWYEPVAQLTTNQGFIIVTVLLPLF